MSRRGWVLFVAMGFIWGIPYLLIKVAVEELTPATLVLARTALGAALLLPIALARGQLRPLVRHWKWFLAYTVIEICVPWLLLGYAELRLSSSLTGLLIAAVPLVGAVLAAFSAERERLDARRAVGLVLGVAGVGALVGFEVGSGDVAAILAIAVVAVCYSVGPIMLSRQLAGVPAMGVVAGSLALAALLYLPVGVAQAPSAWPSGRVVLAVVLLASVCTALAFLVFLALIAEVGPARSVVITYLNPAVAVLLGVVLLDEAFTVATAVGFLLILGGSILATARNREGRRVGRAHQPAAAAAGIAAGIAEQDCADLSEPVAKP